MPEESKIVAASSLESDGSPLNDGNLVDVLKDAPPLEGENTFKVCNPTPQDSFVQDAVSGANGNIVVVVMVGLPARGKTYISRKLARYLNFFHDAPSRVFNIGNYRREMYGASQSHDFFDPDNVEGMAHRQECASSAMKDLKEFLSQPGDHGRVAIYDGTNSTRERRQWILEQLEPFKTGGFDHKLEVIFIETICNDRKLIEENVKATKLNMPDYKHLSSRDSFTDFNLRIKHYEAHYETLSDEYDGALSWVKLRDGIQVTSNRIRGFLPGRILHFVMNLHTTPRPIYLSRHGQSMYNEARKIGGDSGLTALGNEYAVKLGEFAVYHILKDDSRARLWTSSLTRTIDTAGDISHSVQRDGWVTMRPRVWRALDEIHAGIFDGMTYEQIKEMAPLEYEKRRENKLTYRYPRGESYLDVLQRLEPIVHELERHRNSVLIVGHQGILRILYAYFMGLDREEAPFVCIDFNTVTKLIPRAYTCDEEKYLLLDSKDLNNAPSH